MKKIILTALLLLSTSLLLFSQNTELELYSQEGNYISLEINNYNEYYFNDNQLSISGDNVSLSLKVYNSMSNNTAVIWSHLNQDSLGGCGVSDIDGSNNRPSAAYPLELQENVPAILNVSQSYLDPGNSLETITENILLLMIVIDNEIGDIVISNDWDDDKWYNSEIPVSVDFPDDISGIKLRNYEIVSYDANDQPKSSDSIMAQANDKLDLLFEPYDSRTKKLNDEGKHRLTLVVEDNVGNTAELTKFIHIDSIKPEISWEMPVSGTYEQNIFYYNQHQIDIIPTISNTTIYTIPISPIDESSLSYTFNNFYSEGSGLGTSFILLEDGTTDITLYISDQAGNKTSLTHSIVIDTTPPQVVSGGIGITNYWNKPISGHLFFFNEKQGGIDYEEYRIDTGSGFSSWNYQQNFLIFDPVVICPRTFIEEGHYIFEIKFTDYAQNTSEIYHYSFGIDSTPPVFSSLGILNSNIYHNTNKIEFVAPPTATDNLAQIDEASWTYAFAPDATEWYSLSEGINADQLPEGDHQLYLRVADRAGNRTISDTGLPFSVDRTAPVINSCDITSGGEQYTFNPDSNGTIHNLNGTEEFSINYIKDPEIIFDFDISDADISSVTPGEIQSLYYTTNLNDEKVHFSNGEPFILDTRDWELSANAIHQVDLQFIAVDKAGNESSAFNYHVIINSYTPETPLVQSPSHKPAQSLEDSVPFSNAVFDFRMSVQNGITVNQLKAYRWELWEGESLPSANKLDQGITDENQLYLLDLENNRATEYYFLQVWAVGDNGLESLEPAVYTFRIAPPPLEGFYIYSPTHCDENIFYNNDMATISWERPQSVSAVLQYSYYFSTTPILPETLPENYISGENFTVIDAKSLTIDLQEFLESKAGEVYITVCAENYRGHHFYDQIKVAFDVQAPTADIISGNESTDIFAPSIQLSNPGDNITENIDHYSVKLLQKYPDQDAETLFDWIHVSKETSEIQFPEIDSNLQYVIALVRVYDQSGNYTQYYRSFDKLNVEFPSSVDALPYESNIGGFRVFGEYYPTLNSGTAFLRIPDSLNMTVDGEPCEIVELNDTTFTDDKFVTGSNYNTDPFKFQICNYSLFSNSINMVNGLLQSELFGYWFNDAENNSTLRIFPDLSIASSTELVIQKANSINNYTFHLSVKIPTFTGSIEIPAITYEAQNFNLQTVEQYNNNPLWFFSNILETSFQKKSWYLNSPTLNLEAWGPTIVQDSSVKIYRIIDDEEYYTLNVEKMGISQDKIPLDGQITSDFYLEAMDNTFYVTEAIIRGDEIIIIKANLLLPEELTSDTIEIDNFSIDYEGHLEEKIDFYSTPFTLTQETDDGTETITVNSLKINDEKLVIGKGTLEKNGISYTVDGAAISETGVSVNTDTFITGLSFNYHGFSFTNGTGERIPDSENRFLLTSVSMELPTNYKGLTENKLNIENLEIINEMGNISIISAGTSTNVDPILLNTPYDTDSADISTAIAKIRVTQNGVFTTTFTIKTPSIFNLGILELSNLELFSDGTVGKSDPIMIDLEDEDFKLLNPEYILHGASVYFDTNHLIVNNINFELNENYSPSNLVFDDMAINRENVVKPGIHKSPVILDDMGLKFELFNPLFDSNGINCQSAINLPQQFGFKTIHYDDFHINADASYETGASRDNIVIPIHGWPCRVEGINFIEHQDQLSIQIEEANVMLYSLMGWGELSIPNVLLDQSGKILQSGIGSETVNFLSTNGFEVDASSCTFTENGLFIGGSVYLPEWLCKENTPIAVEYTENTICLDSKGAIITPQIDTETVTTYHMGGFDLNGSGFMFDHEGLTIGETKAKVMELPEITFPPITYYPSGEIKINGKSFEGFSYTHESGVGFGVTEFWLDEKGINASAFVNLPPIFGDEAVIYFDRLTLDNNGHFSSETTVPYLDFELYGIHFTFQQIELGEESFSIGNATIVLPDSLENKALRLSNFNINYDGSFELGGLAVDPFELWGYTVYLDSISFIDKEIGFTGGVRLPYDFFIDELAGLRINIDTFTLNLDDEVIDANDVNFEVNVNETFGFDIFDNQFRVKVIHVSVNKERFILDAELVLPEELEVADKVTVSGLEINIKEQAIKLDGIGIDHIIFDYYGHHFDLSPSYTVNSGFNITGMVTLSSDLPDGLAHSILQISQCELTSAGLGNFECVFYPGNLTFFDYLDLSSRAGQDPCEIIFSKIKNSDGNDELSIKVNNGYVTLGDKLPEDLQGIGGNLDFELNYDENHNINGSFTVVSDVLDFDLFDFHISNAQLELNMQLQNGKPDMAVNFSGHGNEAAKVSINNENIPDFIRDQEIQITTFEFNNDFKNVEFEAAWQPQSENLPIDFIEGLYLNHSSNGNTPLAISVKYNSTQNIFDFSLSGAVFFGNQFPEDLQNTELTIEKLELNTNWEITSFKVTSNIIPEFNILEIVKVKDATISVQKDTDKEFVFTFGGQVILPKYLTDNIFTTPEDIPVISINTLKFTLSGELKDFRLSIEDFNYTFFDTLLLTNGKLTAGLNTNKDLIFIFNGALSFTQPLADSLNNPTLDLNLRYSTREGGVLEEFSASLDSENPVESEFIPGLTLVLNKITIDLEGFTIGGGITLPDNLPKGLKNETINISELRYDWEEGLQSLAAGIEEITFNALGFDCQVDTLSLEYNLAEGKFSGVKFAKAVIKLPAELHAPDISIVNGGVDGNGKFFGEISSQIDEVIINIANFEFIMENLSLDFSNQCILIGTATLKLPDNIPVPPDFVPPSFNGIKINAAGIDIGGIDFTLPSFDIAGLSFRNTYLRLGYDEQKDKNDEIYRIYYFSGGGEITIPGIGTSIGIDISIGEVNPEYPEFNGLRLVRFSFETNPGIPLANTGFNFNKFIGGFYIGTKEGLPSEVKKLFSDEVYLEVGIGIQDSSGGNLVRTTGTMWIGLQSAPPPWVYQGSVELLNGFIKSTITSAISEQGFYGNFQLSMLFAHGSVTVYVWNKKSKTNIAGTGSITITVPKAFFVDFWFLKVPDRNWDCANGNAEFGRFEKRGGGYITGVKGSVKVPLFDRVSIFVYPNWFDLDVNRYTLVKPDWARSNILTPNFSISDPVYSTYSPDSYVVNQGHFIPTDRLTKAWEDVPDRFFFNTSNCNTNDNFTLQSLNTTSETGTLTQPNMNLLPDDISASDEKLERIVYILGYTEGCPDLIAIGPSQKKYQQGDPNVFVERTDNQLSMIILSPESGDWECQVINGLHPETYKLFAFGVPMIPELNVFSPSEENAIIDNTFTITGKAELAKEENAMVEVFLSNSENSYLGIKVAETTTDLQGNFSTEVDTHGISEGPYFIFCNLSTETQSGIKAYAPGSINIIHTENILPPENIIITPTENILSEQNDYCLEINFDDTNGMRTKGYELNLDYQNENKLDEIINIGLVDSMTISGFEANEMVYVSLRAYDKNNSISSWSPPVAVPVIIADADYNSFTIENEIIDINLPIAESLEYTLEYTTINPHSYANGYDLLEAKILETNTPVNVVLNKNLYDLTQESDQILINLFANKDLTPGTHEMTLRLNNKANKNNYKDILLRVHLNYPQPDIFNINPKSWNSLYTQTFSISGQGFFDGCEVRVNGESCNIQSVSYFEIIAEAPAGINAGSNIECIVTYPDSTISSSYSDITIVEPGFSYIGLVSDLTIPRGGSGKYQLKLDSYNEYNGTGEISFVSSGSGISVTPQSVVLSDDSISYITVDVDPNAPLGQQSIIFQSPYNPSIDLGITVVDSEVSPCITNLSEFTVSSGEQVTIFGYSFGNSGILYLNNAEVPTTSWSDSEINFIIPDNAETSDLKVKREIDDFESNTITIFIKNSDFSLYSTSDQLQIEQGSTEYSLDLFIVGNAELVDLSATSSSPLLQATLLESQIIPNGNTKLNLNLDPQIECGLYQVLIQGNSIQSNTDSITKTIAINIEIIKPFRITTNQLPPVMNGSTYYIQLDSTENPELVTYELSAGILPKGLSLSTEGILSGRVIDNTDKTFSIKAEDSNGNYDEREFVINILNNSWNFSQKDSGSSNYNHLKAPANNHVFWESKIENTKNLIITNDKLLTLGADGIIAINSETGVIDYSIANIEGQFINYAVSGTSLYLLDENQNFYYADSRFGTVDPYRTQTGVKHFTTNGSKLILAYENKIEIIEQDGNTTSYENVPINTLNASDKLVWQGETLIKAIGNSVLQFNGTGWDLLFDDANLETIFDMAATELELVYTTTAGRLVVQDKITGEFRESFTGITNAQIMLGENRITLASSMGMSIFDKLTLEQNTYNALESDNIAGALEKEFITNSTGLYAVNIYDGSIIWEDTTAEAIDLALNGERLYVLFSAGRLVCFNGPANVLPPTVTHSTNNSPHNNWYPASTQVTLEASDKESYAETIFYRLNDQNFVKYQNPIEIPEGLNSLVYYAMDSHDKRSSNQYATLNCDNTKPVLSYEISGDMYNDYWYHSGVSINSEAFDTLSEIAFHKMKINEDDEFNVTSIPYSIEAEGEYHLSIHAVDNANNVSYFIQDFGIDLENPTIEAHQSSEPGSGIIILTAEDSFSGINTIEYTIDQGIAQIYSEPIIINTAGTYSVSYRAIDNSGRTSEWQNIEITIDAYQTGDWIDNLVFTAPKSGQGLFRDIQTGDPLYGNDSNSENIIDNLPEELEGADYIRFSTGDEILFASSASFTTLKDVDVYMVKHELSSTNLSDWELIQENYPFESDVYFPGGGDIYKKHIPAGQTFNIPGTGTYYGYGNLVFVQYAASNDIKIMEPEPDRELIVNSFINLFGFMKDQSITDYFWEWKLKTQIDWTTIGSGQSKSLELPYVESSTTIEIRLSCTSENGSVFQKIQDHELQNIFDIRLYNPGPNMEYMAGEVVNLDFSAEDCTGNTITNENVNWETSEDGRVWSSVTGNSIVVPTSGDTFYLKALAEDYPGHVSEKQFTLKIVESFTNLTINFGGTSTTGIVCSGEKFGNHENGYLYGFNTDHKDVATSFLFYPPNESTRTYYIPLKENGIFEVASGSGQYTLSLNFAPVYNADNHFITIEGQTFNVYDTYNHMGMLSATVTVTDNVLTITGSENLPLHQIQIKRIAE